MNTHQKKEVQETPKTLVIRLDWWLGRVIAMSWAITELAKQRLVKVITSRPLVFRWNPYIQSVHWLEDRDLFRQVIRWNDYMELEPYTDPRFFNDAVNRLEIARDKLWLDKIAEPKLFLAEHEKRTNVLNWGWKKILFQPFGSTWNDADKSYRSLYVKDAQYIANELRNRWFQVYVIEREDQPRLQGCEAITTRDMRRVVSLAARYPLVWVDSCMHHAAKAFGKQSVVIWAWTDQERYWYESHINLREFPMVAHTPMRLPMNDFNFDISNQHTNEFTVPFLDKVVQSAVELASKCQCC